MKINKKIRDFIRSHEMRYVVKEGYNNVHVSKAFNVCLEEGSYWITLAYGDTPEMLSDKEIKTMLFKSKAGAEKLAEQMRERIRQKNADDKLAAKKKMDEVAKYLKGLCMYDITDVWDKVKDGRQDFIEAIKYAYNEVLPKKLKPESDEQYIEHLVRYIKTGTIYTQGIAFAKDQVACVKYGSDDSIKVELRNGTKITPVSESVIKLLRVLFGGGGRWSFSSIKRPEGEHDKVEERWP